jgi:hypothetical protein
VSVSTPSTSSVSTRCCRAPVPTGMWETFRISTQPDRFRIRIRFCFWIGFHFRADSHRLQQGMRGAWGKPYGSVARVNM